MFWKEYVQRTEPWSLIHFHADGVDGLFECRASMKRGAQEVAVRGRGNGPIAAFVHALAEAGVPRFEVTQFKQHSLSEGEAASAIAYIQIRAAEGMTRWGAGVNTNIELASIQAVISALNRL
jgi:2-isopropylmalate synthase